MSLKRKGVDSYTYLDFSTFKQIKTNAIAEAETETEANQEPDIMNIPYYREDIPINFKMVVKNATHLYSALTEDTFRKEGMLLLLETSLISPNILQRGRFPLGSIKKPGIIQLIYTNLLKKTVDGLSDPKYKTQLNLRGPRGVGKSFLLALYVLHLRTNENNRVLYINNPEDCKSSINAYMANELIYCFLRDRDNWGLPCPPGSDPQDYKKPLEQWYDYTIQGRDVADRMTDCLNSFKNYFIS